tara:strand:- start:16 stop:282 length:267 start_codon:yes stop_codon:yes gene_type:complete
MTKQYEWKVEQFRVSNFGIEDYRDYVDKEYSQGGYKLHTVVPHEGGGNYITFIFEREKKPTVTWDDYDVDNRVDMMREEEALSREEDD